MDNNKKLIPMVQSPVDLGKKDINDILDSYRNSIKNLTLMDTIDIHFDAEAYQMPFKKKFFFCVNSQIYMISVLKDKIKVSVVADFVVKDVWECIHVFNNKSNRKPLKYYLLTLQNSSNKVERNISIAGVSKSDAKKFQETISNSCHEFFINMKDDVFKCFFSDMVAQQVTSTVTIYENAGIIESGKFLYANALATPSGVAWADKEGFIEIETNKYIKLAEGQKCAPHLLKSDKSGKDIAHALIQNLQECWGDKLFLALFVLGQMAMAIFFEQYAKRMGVPTMIIYGDTASGKTTLQHLGISIFGFSENFLISGGSTAKSNEYLSANYNGVFIAIDDVKGTTLTSSNFTSLVKEVYSASPRTKMKAFGKEIEYINTCSPIVLSTNEALPNLLEVVNRLNIVQIFGKAFKSDLFHYHVGQEDNLKELVLILPELIKIPFDSVDTIYNDITQLLKEKTSLTEYRIINNLAYAYTGTQLLLKVADFSIDGLNEQFIEYAKKQGTEYSETKNIVDRVLAEIPMLYTVGQIEKGKHFKVQTQKNGKYEGEHWVCFNKGILISILNKYYSHDKSKYIDEDQFTRYAKNHKRYRDTKTVDFNGHKTHSFCLDITGLNEYIDFLGEEPPEMGASLNPF